MDIRTASLDDAPLLETRGDIDHNTCTSLQEALDKALDSESDVILLDLEEVSYIDSGGLSVLLATVRKLRDRGWLGVLAPNTNVRRLLEIVGLLVDPCFRVFENKDAARAAMLERTLT